MSEQKISCKTDPRAPHGFDRSASHTEDRYVCECESWEPPVLIPNSLEAAALENQGRGEALTWMREMQNKCTDY